MPYSYQRVISTYVSEPLQDVCTPVWCMLKKALKLYADALDLVIKSAGLEVLFLSAGSSLDRDNQYCLQAKEALMP